MNQPTNEELEQALQEAQTTQSEIEDNSENNHAEADLAHKNEREKRESIFAPSAVLDDGTMLEMVYDSRAHTTAFAVYQNGALSYVPQFQLQAQRTLLLPFNPHNTLIRRDRNQFPVVHFPSAAHDYASEEELTRSIQSFIHRHLDIVPLFEKVASYYVLLTWLYDNFNELCYLRALGDWGTGKTRFLQTIGVLCYKPIFASGATTVSPLFRIIDTFKGTLIIDEADFKQSDESAEIVKILNNGYMRGFPVLRSEVKRKNEFEPVSFDVYCPKLIATRSLFHDKALESRCVTEEMGQRRLRNDIPLNLPDSFWAEAEMLRNRLLMFRFKNFGKRELNPELSNYNIEPRLNQVALPLLSMINDDETRKAILAFVQDYDCQLRTDRTMDIDAHVAEVIQGCIASLNLEPTVKDITVVMNGKFKDEYGDRPLTPKKVGNVIRQQLHLKTVHTRVGNIVPIQEQIEKIERLVEKFGLQDAPGLKADTDTMNKVNL